MGRLDEWRDRIMEKWKVGRVGMMEYWGNGILDNKLNPPHIPKVRDQIRAFQHSKKE